MLATWREMTLNQFEAAFCMLHTCIERCPQAAWDAPVVNLAFCQAVFHTLFCADYYLGETPDALRQQPFHRDNEDFFRNYEELQDRKPELLYDKPSIRAYLQHCRDKAAEVITAECEESLEPPSGFGRREFSRAELHVYNIRHIQHHAAQLSLRLRVDDGVEIPWIGSGWCDV